jgi:tRNA pseudouridine65 synthase
VPLEILYQDEHCVAINKPPGLLVHRSKIDVHARENAVSLLSRQIGQRVYTVHRLDRPTSGVLIFGLDSQAAHELTIQFGQRTTSKHYLAVVRGWTDDAGVIDRPLKEHPDRITHPDADRDKLPQEAVTEFETLDRCEIPHSMGRYPTSRYSLVRLHPLTGRRHQLRRHCKHISHPIIGDPEHGDHRHNTLLRETFHIDRLLLAAIRLQIAHPTTGQMLDLSSTPGAGFDAATAALGLLRTRAETSRK